MFRLSPLEVTSDSVLAESFLQVGVRNFKQFIQILFKLLSVIQRLLVLLGFILELVLIGLH